MTFLNWPTFNWAIVLKGTCAPAENPLCQAVAKTFLEPDRLLVAARHANADRVSEFVDEDPLELANAAGKCWLAPTQQRQSELDRPIGVRHAAHAVRIVRRLLHRTHRRVGDINGHRDGLPRELNRERLRELLECTVAELE
jgi:hypothetical protein